MRTVAFKSMKRKSIKFAAMTIHEANMRLLFQLYDVYGDREAANIADLVMEKVTGWKRIDRVANRQVKMSDVMQQQLDRYTLDLLTHKPVQYVLNEAWFGGTKFYVDENVLIPRPETEELVDYAIKDVKARLNYAGISLLDIGTGSGCIPVTIKKNLQQTSVTAVDISEQALNVARKNASVNHADVRFILADILDENSWNQFSSFDYIISNPPYIPVTQKYLMHDNVTRYEPHLALFVPDEDPLLFYKAIARFAVRKLKPGGKIFLELHEHFATSVKEVFASFEEVEVKNDMQGKERFITARLSYQP
jgi:release factor glutamine methyltransferase